MFHDDLVKPQRTSSQPQNTE